MWLVDYQRAFVHDVVAYKSVHDVVTFNNIQIQNFKFKLFGAYPFVLTRLSPVFSHQVPAHGIEEPGFGALEPVERPIRIGLRRGEERHGVEHLEGRAHALLVAEPLEAEIFLGRGHRGLHDLDLLR